MIIILVGESASGKSSIEKALVKNHGLQKVISYTTRPHRDGEVDGIDYHFITDKKFKELQSKNFFGEVGEYRGWHYGSSISDCMKDGMVTVLTPHGFRQMKNINELDIISFYIKVPRRDRIIKILQRGDDIEECYRRNLTDVGMFDGIEDEVDFVLHNKGYVETPEETADKIIKICKTNRGVYE